MKLYQSHFLFAASVLMLTACGDSNEPQPADSMSNEIKFAVVHPSQKSRVTDTNFEAQDKIGVYMTVAGTSLQMAGNELNNELLTYDGAAWNPARRLYWNEGTHDVYAYYPYVESINDTEDYTFDVALDQSVDGAYQASDFLWASTKNVTASESAVTLKFSHSLSKAIVKIEKSAEFEGELPSDCEVYIHNTVPKASIDLTSGGASKNVYAPVTTIRARKMADNLYYAIVVPQNIESRRPLVEIVTKGVSYLMEGKISFRQGYAHTMVVTLAKNPDQTKIEIGGTIGGWN